MRKIERRREMKLHIENLAKIEQADIEINGITVIAGKNNTGKSTVGKILYSLFETFYNYEDRLYKQKFFAIKERLERWQHILINLKSPIDSVSSYKSYLKRINHIVFELINSYNDQITLKQYLSILKEVLKVNGINYNADDGYIEQLAEQIFSIVSINKQREINKLMQSSLQIEFNDEFLPKGNNDDVHVKLEIRSRNISFDIEDNQRKLQVKEYQNLNSEVIYYDNPFIIDRLSKYNFQSYIGSIHENDGDILTHFDRMQIILNRPSDINEANVYNQILSDDILAKIEQDIIDSINGDFILENGNIMFKEKNLETAMEISNLSAGVKSFAILLKLIKEFKIGKNSTLILDEPEVHLHPEWQLKYAKLLVLLQKTLNLHILINSHSPYFINAIEVFSAKYEIANNCKYYLADLNNNYRAYFEDVTKNTEKIYQKLAEPLRLLNDMKYED